MIVKNLLGGSLLFSLLVNEGVEVMRGNFMQERNKTVASVHEHVVPPVLLKVVGIRQELEVIMGEEAIVLADVMQLTQEQVNTVKTVNHLSKLKTVLERNKHLDHGLGESKRRILITSHHMGVKHHPIHSLSSLNIPDNSVQVRVNVIQVFEEVPPVVLHLLEGVKRRHLNVERRVSPELVPVLKLKISPSLELRGERTKGSVDELLLGVVKGINLHLAHHVELVVSLNNNLLHLLDGGIAHERILPNVAQHPLLCLLIAFLV